MARFCASLTAMAVLAGVLPAIAQDKADGAAFQTVITAQLDAIAHDDAATAQSFASPGIKQKFPDPAGFLAMVKQSYAPLVKPRSTHFDMAGDTGLGPMERVTIIDSSGVVWTAVYTFEQVDGQWRITGCSLLKAPDTTA
ncbi:MAG TPA: DUF4864 domain-containing protein [Lichenihabitans sp.]|jgi:hypothetical protein|nr:DUF4864 domain-containing protein [Lichenihabitans sp.]